MNSRLTKQENTKALVQMLNDDKISFSECIRKISIVGDWDVLDQELLDNREIKIKNDHTRGEKNA